MLEPLQPRELVEGPDLLGAAAEIQHQHVFAFDRLLDSRNQDDPAICRVIFELPDVELALVQGNRKGVVAERRGVVD